MTYAVHASDQYFSAAMSPAACNQDIGRARMQNADQARQPALPDSWEAGSQNAATAGLACIVYVSCMSMKGTGVMRTKGYEVP
jgi:hypothetical protein